METKVNRNTSDSDDEGQEIRSRNKVQNRSPRSQSRRTSDCPIVIDPDENESKERCGNPASGLPEVL